MPLVSIQRDHRLGTARAKAVVENLAQRMRDQYHLDVGWENDTTMLFQRTGIEGRIEIEPASIRVDVRLSLMLSPLKNTLHEEIARRLQQQLDEAAGMQTDGAGPTC